jgi:hypothetical protein
VLLPHVPHGSEITEGDYQGTLIASGIGGGVRNSPASTVVVVGGTGKDSDCAAHCGRSDSQSHTVTSLDRATGCGCFERIHSATDVVLHRMCCSCKGYSGQTLALQQPVA